MSTCKIQTKIENLPKLINKLEFFMFQVMKQKGMDFYKIVQEPNTIEAINVFEGIRNKEITKENLTEVLGNKFSQVLLAASTVENGKIGVESYRIAQLFHLLKTVKEESIPLLVNKYVKWANGLDKKLISGAVPADKVGITEKSRDTYKLYATNLQNILVVWDQITPNFLVHSDIFKTKIRFALDENNLIDLNDVADDEQKMLKKMVFDKPSNETDPLDDISKSVELFIKGIHLENEADEYGNTVLVDYPSFVKVLMEELENTTSIPEILQKLQKNTEFHPEYKEIFNKLNYTENPTTEESSFRMSFKKSFCKPMIPIRLLSIEKIGDTIVHKNLEAASNKRTGYEQKVNDNFTLNGMPIMINGKLDNLAHQDENGIWVLTSQDIPKIKKFYDNATLIEQNSRRVDILKALGFEFSPITEKFFKETTYLGNLNTDPTHHKFNYLYKALLKLIERKEVIYNPISDLKKQIPELTEAEKKDPSYWGQNNTITEIIDKEIENNKDFNSEKSALNPDGDTVYSVQQHNNFTILNKFFSDAEVYPDLDSILKEPSMFWMDPRTNPNVRSSYFFNSLFFFDPSDPNFGKRRRVVNNKGALSWSTTQGEFVKMTLVNTGHMQFKDQAVFEKDGASSTSLNELDKLIQDMQAFFATKNGYMGIMRLGDKSTDLGIELNYGYNPWKDNISDGTKLPIKGGKPLGNLLTSPNTIDTKQFKWLIKRALKDFLELKYLANKGFLKDLTVSQKNINDSWGYFDDLLTPELKKSITEKLKDTKSIDDVKNIIKEINEDFEKRIVTHFTEKADAFYNKIATYKKIGLIIPDLLKITGNNQGLTKDNVKHYIASTFISDLDQMKIMFGDAIFFKAFTKRASKDSATGTFTSVDIKTLDDLNNFDNIQGVGGNTNLTGRRLLERMVLQEKITSAEQKIFLERQKVQQSFKSAVLKDVNFVSEHGDIIPNNIQNKLMPAGFISPEMKKLYEKSIKDVIEKKYKGISSSNTEADGQGKCTFDFYRIMSILTDEWSTKQEEVYKKIVDYNHYDELAEDEQNETKKAEYIQLRDAVGYDPTEPVYFPPKKFQYSGPMKYSKMIDGVEWTTAPPIFDKFSLQPLIPTITKQGNVKQADWFLAKKMEFNGVGYVKFESASKTETPSNKDEFYSEYDINNPKQRKINNFDLKSTFKSEQELFFGHLKEQLKIDAEIHDHAVFGSQIRKLILMNLDRPEFQILKQNYEKYIGELAELEKTSIFNEMGIIRENGRLKIPNFSKIVNYFLTEVDKKNQDSNVKKALKYDEATGKFEIPLDASVQSQVLEGIIISAINNRVVRYKTNGSMLVQVALTGSEGTKFNADASAKATETYGNTGLRYYDIIEGKDGKPTTGKMDVKIALTGQWLRLLELDYKGAKIGTIDRLNEALLDEKWSLDNEKHVTMIAYRIPTQGRNFLDVMKIKEFIPASFGDAIIMPSEIVIKNGGDFDIDKMFVFYPNLDKKGNYISYEYDKSMLTEDLETRKDEIFKDLKYLSYARNTTLKDLRTEFEGLEKNYKASLNDVRLKEKLAKLLTKVEQIITVLDAEMRNNIETSFLNTITEKNALDDSVLSQLVKSNASYNVAEYEEWMRDVDNTWRDSPESNIFNPMAWIDKKHEGLNILKGLIETLFNNSDVNYLKSVKDRNEEQTPLIQKDLQEEINKGYEKMYKYNYIKQNIQNKLYETMSDIILHPSNYMELVTPSENFHILPLIEKVFEKLGMSEEGKPRKKTDYKNGEILDRINNIKKFISLLKGKNDLGIAAVANTFNVMFQLSKASSNTKWLIQNNIKTFFDSTFIIKNKNQIENIDYSSIFDEDGMLKSEFFSEFVNAFVDVANDDYVFAANIVTEVSPIAFYMKYSGIGSGKIFNFINQPAIREYTKNLGMYQNMMAKAGGLLQDAEGNAISARKLAMNKTLVDLGYSDPTPRELTDEQIKNRMEGLEPITQEHNKSKISDYINLATDKYNLSVEEKDYILSYRDSFTQEELFNSIKKDGTELSSLTEKEKLIQISMLFEFENLKEQSTSVSEAQKFLNFDTKPFESVFDATYRTKMYERAISPILTNGKKTTGNILSVSTLKNIKEESMISPLDMGKEIRELLARLFPIKNGIMLDSYLLNEALDLKESYDNKGISTTDDVLKLARTAKNDYINFILQEKIGKSEEGMKFFYETFDTDKGFNEYLAELVESNKLIDMFNKVKNMTRTTKTGEVETIQNVFDKLAKEFPFVKNIIAQRGDNNKEIVSFKIVRSGSNVMEKESIIKKFEELTLLKNPEDKPIADFFKNLALYSIFQSGMNTSDISYTNVAPIDIVNKLYGYAVNEEIKEQEAIINNPKLSIKEKTDKLQSLLIPQFDKFFKLFELNNPSFFDKKSIESLIKESNKKGKWYSNALKLKYQNVVAETSNVVEPVESKTTFDYNKAVEEANTRKPIAQNFFDGFRPNSDISKVHTIRPEITDKYGKGVKTITLVKDGVRTRSTRLSNWMRDNKPKVGDYFWQINEKNPDDKVLTKITAVYGRPDPRFKNNWYKEGWIDSDFQYVESYDSAIEFEVVNPVQTTSTVNPLVAAGIKPTDMYGNAAKDIQMASESTQFIGFGTIMKVGNVSSTDKYAKAWGNKANTGVYTANDVIMVSGSGNFGRGGVNKTEEAQAIKNTLTEKYKPLLEKAIAAGASFRIGNQYAKGNLSDELIAKYLKQKGYIEQKFDGYSKWTTTTQPTQSVQLSTTKVPEARKQIQPGFFDYGKLSVEDEKTILNEAIKQTNEQGYPVKKGVVYAHWGHMWAVTDKGADAFPVFGKHLRRSEESAGLGKGLKKIDLPKSNIQHNDDGKGWYDYYPTDQNGNPLNPIPQVVKDILQKKLGIDMSVYDASIINSYGEVTELSRHIDNTEDKNYAYKIPIVSISLIGDSIFQYSSPSDDPNHRLPDDKKVNLSPGQVVIFGGPSRAMAHRVLNGKSGNAINIKNSINSLNTERINITLRRALPLTKEEYDKWVNNTKVIKEDSAKQGSTTVVPTETTSTSENDIIEAFRQEAPFKIEKTNEELLKLYNEEQLSGQTLREFLETKAC